MVKQVINCLNYSFKILAEYYIIKCAFTSFKDNMKNKKNKKLLCKKNKKKKSKKSVLQAKLGKLAMQIGYVGISAAVLTFIILCLRLSIDEFAVKKNEWSNGYIRYFFSFLTQAVTVIVVAVPEGLPLAVTLSLAFAVRVSNVFLRD